VACVASDQLVADLEKPRHEAHLDEYYELITSRLPTQPQQEVPPSKELDYSHLKAIVEELPAALDRDKVQLRERQIETLGVKLIYLGLEIEKQLQAVLCLLQRLLMEYNQTELLSARYRVFDPLTAMLGKQHTLSYTVHLVCDAMFRCQVHRLDGCSHDAMLACPNLPSNHRSHPLTFPS
jgi:hypothetical protein